jgi:hypothetical protein
MHFWLMVNFAAYSRRWWVGVDYIFWQLHGVKQNHDNDNDIMASSSCFSYPLINSYDILNSYISHKLV